MVSECLEAALELFGPAFLLFFEIALFPAESRARLRRCDHQGAPPMIPDVVTVTVRPRDTRERQAREADIVKCLPYLLAANKNGALNILIPG